MAADPALTRSEIPGMTVAERYVGHGFAVAVGIGVAVSVAGVILVEYLALSRLTVAVTAWPLRRVIVGIGVIMVAAAPVLLIALWFIGWNLILEYLFAVATVSTGWSGYVLSLLEQFNIHLPAALTHAPFDQGTGSFSIVSTGAIINLPAMAIVGAIATICYIGIKQSATFNSVIVAIKVTVVILFIFLGVSYINTDNWHPFIPPNTGVPTLRRARREVTRRLGTL